VYNLDDKQPWLLEMKFIAGEFPNTRFRGFASPEDMEEALCTEPLPDAVVLDWVLHGGRRGADVIPHVSEAAPRAPIRMMTAFGQDAEAGRRAGELRADIRIDSKDDVESVEARRAWFAELLREAAVQRCVGVFERELDELLQSHRGWLVAYVDDQRVALERRYPEIVARLEELGISDRPALITRVRREVRAPLIRPRIVAQPPAAAGGATKRGGHGGAG
jgi:DNA-binding NarL/FixJ family response regulator